MLVKRVELSMILSKMEEYSMVITGQMLRSLPLPQHNAKLLVKLSISIITANVDVCYKKIRSQNLKWNTLHILISNIVTILKI